MTARYADIVLPAATYLETEDFYRAYGAYYLQYAPAAVPPQGEARSNFRLAQDLAARMGLDLPIYRAPAETRSAELLRGAKGATAGLDAGKVRHGGPIRLAADEGQQFRTPSGRLEFYSEQLAAPGLAPMPDWQPDPDEERDAARWPLRLLTAPGYFQAHTAYAGVGFLRRREGAPFCDSPSGRRGPRGLGDGAKVRLRNERGESASRSRSATRSGPAWCWCPVSAPPARRSRDDQHAVSDRYTDLGEGATYQSTFLEVEAWPGA